MIKKTIDFKLVNIALIALICYFIYQASDLWFLIINKIVSIFLPIIIGFSLAYAIYPFFKMLNKYVNKIVAVIIIIFIVILIIYLIFILLIPLLFNQIVNLINSLLYFIKNVSNNFQFDLNKIEENLIIFLNQIITNLGKYISATTLKTINVSINIITNAFIAISSGIYFLLDMEKIRNFIKDYIKNKKILKFLSLLDYELQKYFKGCFLTIFITFIEYTLIYFIIGHPDFLLLGILSSLGNLIPYFGGMLVVVVGVISGVVISKKLAITVIIVTFISSLFDSYILNPFIYKKSNKLHPIVVIISVFASGILFGFMGVLIAIPLAILIITSYRFYKENVEK